MGGSLTLNTCTQLTSEYGHYPPGRWQVFNWSMILTCQRVVNGLLNPTLRYVVTINYYSRYNNPYRMGS